MNRFSKDIGVVDEHLPQVLFEFLQVNQQQQQQQQQNFFSKI